MATVRHLRFVIKLWASLETHEEYLMVFITLQNFVTIDAVISIICKC